MWLEEKNKEVFDEEDWFNTGDIAEILPNGALRILDRAYNVIRLRTPSDSCYCQVDPLEKIYKKEPLVSEILVHGDFK